MVDCFVRVVLMLINVCDSVLCVCDEVCREVVLMDMFGSLLGLLLLLII